MTALAIILLFALAAIWAIPARSGSSPTPLIQTLNGQVERIRNVRAVKCLSRPVFRWHPGYQVPAHMRLFVIGQRRARLAANRARESQCIPWPWNALAECESGGNWAYNGPSGFDGGLQFLPSTWNTARRLVGVDYAYAYQAPAVVQVRVAQAWLAVTSWAQWPACSAKLGLR